MFLKMLTGTRADEDESYDNIIICISVSTVLMVFTSFMEALTYYLYSNKVQIILKIPYANLFFSPSKYFPLPRSYKRPRSPAPKMLCCAD